jgi:hypothetical protein
VAVASYGPKSFAAAAFSITATTTNPNIGKVASAAAGDTTFTVVASTGSTSVTGGAGGFIPPTPTRTALTTIVINCSGGSSCGNDTTVTITTAAGTGRGKQITGLSAAFGYSGAATWKSGPTSGGASLSFVIAGVGNNNSKSFRLGVVWPIAATGTIGTATGPYTVQVTASGVTSASRNLAANANVQAGISLSQVTPLDFGTLALMAGQSGSVTYPAGGQGAEASWSLTGAQQVRGHTIGKYKVTGTPGQQISVSVTPIPTLTLTRQPSGGSLPMSVSNTAQGAQLIPLSGEFFFYIGGSINFSSSTTTGAYKGIYTITVNYS